MGCTSSILTHENTIKSTHQITLKTSKQMIPLQFYPRINDTVLGQDQDDFGCELFKRKLLQYNVNPKMKKTKQKRDILHQNKMFIGQSIQMSQQINKAILTISNNPYLKDDSYKKLIGINKKILLQKHNRLKNLEKRQEKALFELEKQKNLVIKKSKSQIFKSKTLSQKDKENYVKHQRHLSLKPSYNFKNKLGTIQQALNQSQSYIHF